MPVDSGNNGTPPPRPLLILGSLYEIDRERNSATVSGGEGSGVQGDVGGHIHEEDDQEVEEGPEEKGDSRKVRGHE